VPGTGSRRAFTYTDDNGDEWICKIDETTGESGSLGFGQQPSAAALTANRYLRMSGKFPIEPRYVLCVQQDGDTIGRRQKFYVGTNTSTAWGGAKILTVDGVTYEITAKVGEVRHYLPSTDTGLDDGDDDTVAP